MKIYLIWSKLKQRKTRKRFYENSPFKEGDKMLCSSRIKEDERRTKLISSFFEMKKPKAPNMKNIKDIILCEIIKVKIQYCLLEVTEIVLESKIFKIRDTVSATYDSLILFSS